MPAWLRGLVCVGVVLLLPACGFRPLYGTLGADSASVSTRLASVAIPDQSSRAGQLIRNAMLSAISPAGTSAPTAYRFDMTPKGSEQNSVEAQNTDVLRVSYRLNVSFELVDISTGKALYSGKTFSYVSYDRTGTPFANQQARTNAEERAAREVALDMRTRLAAYFANH